MWASIALSVHSNDSMSNDDVQSTTSSGSSGTSSSTVSSWSTASTSTTTRSSFSLRKSLLVDYTKSPHDSSDKRRESLQTMTTSRSSVTSCSSHGTTSLSSFSTSRLQKLMLKEGNRRASTGMTTTSRFAGDSLLASTTTHSSSTSSTFSRHRMYERQQLVKVLHQALQDRKSDENEEPVQFQLKKNCTGVMVPPATLKRSHSNASTHSSSGTMLDELLKESRREKLSEMLDGPSNLRRLNTSSLRASFHTVTAVGANQQKRLSSLSKQRALAATIATAAAAKATKLASTFHKSVRDFSQQHPTAVAIKNAKRVLRPVKEAKAPKPMRRLLDDNSSQQKRRKTMMRRSASAPRNSFKKMLSFKTQHSRGHNSFTALSRQTAELAALKALAGSTMTRRRTSFINKAGVPTTITVLKRHGLHKSKSSRIVKEAPLPMPPLARARSTPHPVKRSNLLKLQQPPATPPVSRPRRASLAKLQSARHHLMDDGSLSSNENNTSKHRRFQRVAQLTSSRKSLELMIQNANIHSSSQECMNTRGHKLMQRAESSRNNTAMESLLAGSSSDDSSLEDRHNPMSDSSGGRSLCMDIPPPPAMKNRRAFMKRQDSLAVGSRIRTLRS